jgi:hypothetical protein
MSDECSPRVGASYAFRDEIDNEPVLDPVDQCVQQLKGTLGRWGILDKLKFSVGMFIKRSFCNLTRDEERQKKFYDEFQVLKEALKASSSAQRTLKLQASYNRLRDMAARADRASLIDRYQHQALLRILKDELSEQVTKELLHDILLHEGTKLATDEKGNISLQNFTISLLDDAAKELDVARNYGTREEATKALIEAAAQLASQAGNENALPEFVHSLEESIQKFQTQNFAPQQEVESYLKGWADSVNQCLLSGIPLTLEKIQSAGVFLKDHIADSQKFFQVLERICLKQKEVMELSKQTAELDLRVKEFQVEIERKVEILRRTTNAHDSVEVIQFIGEGMQSKKGEEYQEELDILDKKCRQQLSTIAEIHRKKKLLENLPEIPKQIEQKEKELQALKQKYQNSSRLSMMLEYELTMLREDLKTAETLDIAKMQSEIASLPQLEQEFDQSRKAYTQLSDQARRAHLVGLLQKNVSIELTDAELSLLSQVATGPTSGFLARDIARAQKTAAELKKLQEELAQIKPQAAALRERFEEAKKNAGPLFTKEDFPLEIVQSLTQHIHEKFKAYRKEALIKTLDIIQQVAAVKAESNLHTWETTFRSLDPSLQQAYLASGRVIVQFSPDQLSMVRCQELKDRLE